MRGAARLALVVALGIGAPAEAQIRASELGSITQTIDGTKLTVEYSRPRSRGRDPLFGTRAVHWDEVWTPGANWATTLDVSRNVKLNGNSVPKGKYSVWLIVRKSGDWTAVLEPRTRLFHMSPPDSNATQVRFPVKRQEVTFTDVLTWSFPALRANGGTLALEWERTRIAMDIEVEPSLKTTMREDDARQYVGRYDYTEKGPNDTPITKTFILSYEDKTLKGEWIPSDPYMKRFAMLRISPDWFTPGLYDARGQIYEVLRPDMVFEFRRDKGTAVSFEVRDDEDKVFATGTRKP